MPQRVVVLGAGRVGLAIVRDLAQEPDLVVTAVDRDTARLEQLTAGDQLEVRSADLADGATVTELGRTHDLAINALPGALGARALRTLIAAGQAVTDISFMPEDPLSLDDLARERGATAVVDAGVAPGLSHLLVGRLAAELGSLEEVRILVGGLPAEPREPWKYGAVFSPADVLEEYTRPARIVQDGRVVELDPLAGFDTIELPGVGPLEAFVSDGLRTLLTTIEVPNMQELTLRYHGHLVRIRVLADSGLLDREPVDVGGASIRPIDLTAVTLAEQWKLDPGEADLTVMRVEAVGRRDDERLCVSYSLLDRYDTATDTTSMARTTGYTCTALARLMLAGKIAGPGVIPPETVGRDAALFDAVLADLADRGITLSRHEEWL